MGQKMKMRLLLIVLLIVTKRKFVAGNYEKDFDRNSKYLALLDHRGNNLCAVVSSQQQEEEQTTMTRASLLRCASLCSQLSDCVMFNEYDNAICELVTTFSGGTFLRIDACKAYADASLGSNIRNDEDEFGPIRRNLTMDVFGSAKLYYDGIQVYLPNGAMFRSPYSVDFPDATSLIAVELNQVSGEPRSPDFIASTEDGYILTNTTWKCAHVYSTDWELKGFDDSLWSAAICSLTYSSDPVAGVREDTCWIWSTGSAQSGGARTSYCRLNLHVDRY